MKDIFLTVKKYADSCGITALIENSSGVIVGFSGGADSVFLLSFFKDYLSLFSDTKILAAAHLNHMIRGSEADSDCDFCREFCKNNGIRFFEKKVDIPKESAKAKCGTEEYARKVRYAFFDECAEVLAEENGCEKNGFLISTAHNASDNLETVIFNLARGSGISGIRGIQPIRDKRFIRPVLCITGDEIRNYCTDAGIDFVVDSTNSENEYTRNKIRHGIVPILREINPSADKASVRMSSLLSADEEFINNEADKAYTEVCSCEDADVSLLKNLENPILSRVVLKMLKSATDSTVSEIHIDAVCAMIKASKSGKLHLPGNITAIIGNRLIFKVEKDKNAEDSAVRDYCYPLSDGENFIEEDGSVITFGKMTNSESESAENHGNIYNKFIYIIAVNDTIKGNIFVRSKRDGDTVLCGGHHRKIKKLFNEKKLPEDRRRTVPVICDDDGILWIPGICIRDGAKATKGNGKYLITYRTKS